MIFGKGKPKYPDDHRLIRTIKPVLCLNRALISVNVLRAKILLTATNSLTTSYYQHQQHTCVREWKTLLYWICGYGNWNFNQYCTCTTPSPAFGHLPLSRLRCYTGTISTARVMPTKSPCLIPYMIYFTFQPIQNNNISPTPILDPTLTVLPKCCY